MLSQQEERKKKSTFHYTVHSLHVTILNHYSHNTDNNVGLSYKTPPITQVDPHCFVTIFIHVNRQ